MSCNKSNDNLLALPLMRLCVCLSALVLSIAADPLESQPGDWTIEVSPENNCINEKSVLIIRRLLARHDESRCKREYFDSLNWAVACTGFAMPAPDAQVLEKRRSTFLECKPSFEKAARVSARDLDPMEGANVRHLVDSIHKARPQIAATPSTRWDSQDVDLLVEFVLTTMSMQAAFVSSQPLTESEFEEEFEKIIGRSCSYICEKMGPSVETIRMYLDKDFVEEVSLLPLYWARATSVCLRVKLHKSDMFKVYRAGTFEAAMRSSGKKCTKISRLRRWVCLSGAVKN